MSTSQGCHQFVKLQLKASIVFESHHFQEAQAEEDHDPLLLLCPLAAHVSKLQIYRENCLLSFGVQG